MTSEEILNLKNCIVKNPREKYFSAFVYIVQKCNFNDEFLIEEKWLSVAELQDKPLEWFDPYLGKNPKSKTQIAFAYIEGANVYFLERTDGEIKLVKKNEYTHYFTDDYDERTLIAAHIDGRTRKF